MNFAILTLLLLGAHYLICAFQKIPFEGSLGFIHIFFFLVSISAVGFLFKNLNRVQGFMQRFFGFTTIKLLLSFGVMAAFILTYGKEESISFVISFVVLYLVYTTFESLYIIKRFKSISKDLSTKAQ